MHVPIIYNQLSRLEKVENLDIFLFSLGGDPDAAYKIAKMCRQHCKNKLSVIIPFMAKSAATLLAIGTDEIVMGPPSELGPIDPQIFDKSSENWGAVQAIRDCIDFLENRFRESKDMDKTMLVLMPILDKLNPFVIGNYERAVKMSKQYAEILLRNGMLKNKDTCLLNEVVCKLSEVYYSHGYAINANEAKNELMLNVESIEDGELWGLIWRLFLYYHIEMVRTKSTVRYIEVLESIGEELEDEDEDEAKDEAKDEDGNEDEEETEKDIEENQEEKDNRSEEEDYLEE